MSPAPAKWQKWQHQMDLNLADMGNLRNRAANVASGLQEAREQQVDIRDQSGSVLAIEVLPRGR